MSGAKSGGGFLEQGSEVGLWFPAKRGGNRGRVPQSDPWPQGGTEVAPAILRDS